MINSLCLSSSGWISAKYLFAPRSVLKLTNPGIPYWDSASVLQSNLSHLCQRILGVSERLAYQRMCYSGAGEDEGGGAHSSVICGSISRRLGNAAVTNWNEVSSPDVTMWPKSAGFEPCPCS